MLGIDTEIGTSALRVWVAAESAALLIAFCILAYFRPRSRTVGGAILRANFVIWGAVLGAALSWAFLEHSAPGDRDRSARGDLGAERRALELRTQELSAQALAPGSPLACLDAVAGDSVEAACEKALFLSPASVAAASSYVAARFALLSGMAGYAQRGGVDIDDVLLPLRRSLEADRFGFLAHMLATRDGCTSENCKVLAVLGDPNRVLANLSAHTLDGYLEHYQELWAKPPDAAPTEGAQTSAPSTRKIVNIDFPTAASIPPVSIMNPEPTGPVLPGVAAAAAGNPNPRQNATSTPRRPHKQAASASTQTAIPSPTAGSANIEPVWPEPVPPPPPSQSEAAPTDAPAQLNPPSSSASAGATNRAQ